jgi:hypothetical protein
MLTAEPSSRELFCFLHPLSCFQGGTEVLGRLIGSDLASKGDLKATFLLSLSSNTSFSVIAAMLSFLFFYSFPGKQQKIQVSILDCRWTGLPPNESLRLLVGTSEVRRSLTCKCSLGADIRANNGWAAA